MFAYYCRVGIASLKRHPALSALMILAIAIGIGVFMTTLTVYSLMSNDPIPEKSAQLFAVRLDSWGPDAPWDEPNVPPPELTWRDANALMKSTVPLRHAAMYKASFALETDHQAIPPYQVIARVSHKDFFGLFNVPFLYGGAWGSSADQSLSQVVVISKQTNDKLFGGNDSVGKTLRLDEHDFKIVGVIDDWRPTPLFYDVNNGPFREPEAVYLPWSITEAFQQRTAGNSNSWSTESINSFHDFINSESVWIQFWAELPNDESKQRYQTWLDAYVTEQKKQGRFQRPLNNTLSDVNQYMAERDVVSSDNRILVGLSFMFLAVCLINMTGLLLAKFIAKSPELALRRALGASQFQIITLNLIEVGIVGLLGGMLGLLLTYGGLAVVKMLYADYERLATLNVSLMLQAILVAILASLFAGLYPAWKVGRIAPAGLLKTQ